MAVVLIRNLAVGAPFIHARDEGPAVLQPERVFRVVASRARTAIVESGIGVRTTMSKRTQIVPLAAEQWERLARPGLKAAG